MPRSGLCRTRSTAAQRGGLVGDGTEGKREDSLTSVATAAIGQGPADAIQ
jgi:hypothetical protein